MTMSTLMAMQPLPGFAGESKATTATTTIGNHAELDRHLAAVPLDESPLGALSPQGRHDFIESLRFGRSGLGGFSFSPLVAELDAAQAEAVLALFGAPLYASIRNSIADGPADRRARAVAVMSGTLCQADTRCPPMARDARLFQARLSQRQEQAVLPREARVAATRKDARRLLVPHDTPESLENADDASLELMYDATQQACATLMDRVCTDRLASLLTEIDARGFAGRRHHVGVFNSHVAARDFDAAQALLDAYPLPDQQALPERVDRTEPTGTRPTAWRIDSTARQMTRETIRLDPRAQVVVSASPKCHFSNNAMRAIEADPELATAMQDAIWLEPQGGSIHFDDLQAWNREHPGIPVMLVHDADEWPGIDTSATPIFHVLVDGQVQTTIDGWPETGGELKLREALQSAGLLDP